MAAKESVWWVGANDEFLNIGGPFDTREEAIAAGENDRPGEPFYICRAILKLWQAPNAASVIDNWIEDCDDLWFDDGFPGFSGPKDHEKAAEYDLQTVLNEWFSRHAAMLPEPNAFESSCDGEWFNLPQPSEEIAP